MEVKRGLPPVLDRAGPPHPVGSGEALGRRRGLKQVDLAAFCMNWQGRVNDDVGLADWNVPSPPD